MLRMCRYSLVSVALLIAPSCGKTDNAAGTDRASHDLRKAESTVSESGKDLAKNQDEIEQRKRAVVREQQELADKQVLLEHQRLALGSALGGLQDARVAYAAALKERFAKLDASLATLATKTDARSRDASTGLRARRDQLFARVDAAAATPESSWATYTKDIDVTFDAIERDLHEALR